MSANGNVAVAGLLQLTTVVRRHEGTCSNKYHTELRERLQFLVTAFFLYTYIFVYRCTCCIVRWSHSRISASLMIIGKNTRCRGKFEIVCYVKERYKRIITVSRVFVSKYMALCESVCNEKNGRDMGETRSQQSVRVAWIIFSINVVEKF